MSVVVSEVGSASDLKRFIKLPWSIYKGDPNWVPPLIIDQKAKFNRDKNPFFKHSTARFYLAEKEGKIAGRIAGIINNNHNKFHEENIGFFGFFECVNDHQVADALFEKAAEYLRSEGVVLMRGPANFSSNDDWGFLVNAFDKPPMVMMPYNPPYYLELAESFGFKKVMNLYAYWMLSDQMTERVIRTAEIIKKRTKTIFRNINMNDFTTEVERIRRVYNAAWSRNWGFVPMTESEFNHTAKDLKQIVNPRLVFIAESNGKPVGFSLALPDVNQALIHLNGRLFPFGILKLLYHMKRIHTLRVITMGVIPEYQKRGIDVVFYYETFKAVTEMGFDSGEFSWVLEINDMMNRAAQNMGGKIYKTYRLYDYTL